MYLQLADKNKTDRHNHANPLRVMLFVGAMAGALASANVSRAAQASASIHALSAQLAGYVSASKPPALARRLRSSTGPAHLLYRVAEIEIHWSQYKKQFSTRTAMGKKYITDVNAILQSDGNQLSGAWLIAGAKFILAELAIPSVNQIEYWSGTAATRAKLAPLAETARRLLAAARRRYQAITTRMNNLSNFTHADDILYERADSSLTQVNYFGAYADYYRGLSLSRRSKRRDGLMLSVVKAVAQWANGPASSGVKFQSLLLSGKANMRAGRTADAVSDLKRACKPPSPAWLAYEAQYQWVVADLRGGHYGQAAQQAKNFRAWLLQHKSLDSQSARMGLKLLEYRIAYAKADAIHSPDKRRKAVAQAMNQLLDIIAKAPQYQQLIFTHITAGLAPKPDMKTIAPVQVLAIAWINAQKNNPADVKMALSAAEYLLKSPGEPSAIKAQAQLIAGICYASQGDIARAAQINLEFVKQNPDNKQASPVLNIALSQLQTLNQAPSVSAAVTRMTGEAISLAYKTFHEKQWRFAYAVTLQQARHYRQAARIFAAISAKDPQYFQAQYQLVRIYARQLTELMAKNTDVIRTRSVARKVIHSAQRLLSLIKHPPAGTSAGLLKQTSEYRPRLLMLMASTALDPLREPLLAGNALRQLDAMKSSLTDPERGIVLRYRIRQYQLMGKSDKILPLIKRYAKGTSQNADDVIKGLIGQYLRESRRLRHTDLAKSQALAANAASLLKQLINAMVANPKKHKRRMYVYQQLRAQELIYAGLPEEALALYKRLEKQNPRDLGNFIGGARAAYAIPNFSLAHSLYVRIIPKLEPGTSLYWQAYLYLIRSNIRSNMYHRQTVQTLKSLVAIYGSTIGGKYYKKQYQKLLRTYGISAEG